MKILLDENFPLPLYHRLRAAGHDAEHIIVLGQRGIPDSAIRRSACTTACAGIGVCPLYFALCFNRAA